MPDIPRDRDGCACRAGALVIDDNTWGGPRFYHRSLDQGVDISMQAATKYVGGHSDIMFGTISANAKAWPMISEAIRLLGVCAGPDGRVFWRCADCARSRCGWRSTIDPRSRSRAWLETPARGSPGVAPGSRKRPGVMRFWKRDF